MHSVLPVATELIETTLLKRKTDMGLILVIVSAFNILSRSYHIPSQRMAIQNSRFRHTKMNPFCIISPRISPQEDFQPALLGIFLELNRYRDRRLTSLCGRKVTAFPFMANQSQTIVSHNSCQGWPERRSDPLSIGRIYQTHEWKAV